MKLIVGLGNPGIKYAGTRHNVGFDVIDYLSQAPSTSPAREKFQALTYEQREGGEAVLLMKPLTFMNLSGRAVRAAVDFYKLSLSDLFIISDDFNLPLGKLRVRTKGSHGGQNGLRDIQQQLGTDEFTRLRIGVGQPEPGEAIDFVLSKFKPGERSAVKDAVANAAQAVLLWTRSGAEACMNRFNAGEEKKPNNKDAGEKRKPTKPENGNATPAS